MMKISSYLKYIINIKVTNLNLHIAVFLYIKLYN